MASSIWAMRSSGTIPTRLPIRLTSTDLICSAWAFESRLRPVLAASSITWNGWTTSVLEVPSRRSG